RKRHAANVVADLQTVGAGDGRDRNIVERDAAERSRIRVVARRVIASLDVQSVTAGLRTGIGERRVRNGDVVVIAVLEVQVDAIAAGVGAATIDGDVVKSRVVEPLEVNTLAGISIKGRIADDDVGERARVDGGGGLVIQ